MEDNKVLHRVLRGIASWAVYSFFTEVRVIGEENVPRHGPLIVYVASSSLFPLTSRLERASGGVCGVCILGRAGGACRHDALRISTATHHNMMLDPAILSSAFPYKRMLHYWSKGAPYVFIHVPTTDENHSRLSTATLFTNPIVRRILISTGNIPVDRKSKDRQALFRGTFDALAQGAAVALFPEGTSYTEPRIMQVKDGAAWAALEYTKWASGQPVQSPLVLVPAAIVYTNKSKYRSRDGVNLDVPIALDPYMDQFLSTEEGANRAAVKRLTRAIEVQLVELTINAPDWDTLYAARMARDLLWEDENSLNRDEFVQISQTLVDLFSTPDATPNFNSVKRRLLEYYSLLQSTQLTNSVLSALPLPDTLDPHRPVPLPSRLFTLLILIRDSIACLVRLPFFLFPLIIHMPAYVMGRLGARLVEHEEETQAQNKILFGLLLLSLIYPAAFFFFWAFLWYTPMGALFAFLIVWLTAVYHTKLINDNYEHVKRLAAAWRVLIGVWAPKRFEYPLATLAQYTTTPIPPVNPWISGSGSSTPKPESQDPTAEPPVKTNRKRRPHSGRVMRHVLRARAEAVRALASFIDQLEKGPAEKRVRAAPHLACAHGGGVDDPQAAEAQQTEGGVVPPSEPVGWRYAREVVAFLRKRGAKVATLERGIEAEWAALNSDGEMSPAEDGEDRAELVFLSPVERNVGASAEPAFVFNLIEQTTYYIRTVVA
ncbi:hypothetical protein EW146_g6264 [Bondarzewia mesenterica]|uniref:Phospholipid/glycerol acyltransferase domain-containing protein n=1 Tax=Bondarzewia mesenterica TaxID=1095465 RepID=A0A4S4LP50_9AGAM|nr:hypothetical protein EW146_g6264 [Bondarzewia mesenterica]